MTAPANDPEERERVLSRFVYELRAIHAAPEELALVETWFQSESPRLPALVTARVIALRIARDAIERAAQSSRNT